MLWPCIQRPVDKFLQRIGRLRCKDANEEWVLTLASSKCTRCHHHHIAYCVTCWRAQGMYDITPFAFCPLTSRVHFTFSCFVFFGSCGAIPTTWGARGTGNRSLDPSRFWWACCLAGVLPRRRWWSFSRWRSLSLTLMLLRAEDKSASRTRR